jgi:hypothetical protein
MARRLGVTPNAITIASIFLGIGAGIAFYFNSLWINIIGIVLLVWANSFDSADGQLARMTGQYSRLGRILDGVSGDLWFVSIYVAICLRENYTSDFFMAHTWVIWVMAVAAGLCHSKQAAMADYYRQFHLYFVKGREGSELEDSRSLSAKLTALSWKNDFWKKLTLLFYTNYTVSQEAHTRSMQALRAELHSRFADGEIPDGFRADFRAASLPLMKWTNILSFNFRSWTLFASLLMLMPWIYFAVELTLLNLLLIYMNWRHEKMCRRFTNMLKDGKY